VALGIKIGHTWHAIMYGAYLGDGAQMAKPASKKRKSAKTKKQPAGRGKSSPTKDAPWDVDVSNDGDFASPRIDLDENDIKEREDRKS
jgi:hypothetical protein